jgi:hypothetical protein
MTEAAISAPTDLSADLDRIGAAVDAGNTDLKALGFWRLVALVKPDRLLVDRYADQIGRIDGAAFRAFARFRMPVWVGNTILLIGAAVGLAAAIVARSVSSATLAGLLLIAAGALWTVTLHCPMHWFVGYMVSIRFTDYFVGGPPPPRPGLKSDYATYLKAEPGMDACVRRDRQQARTVPRPGVLARVWSAVVERGGVDRDRRDHDRHGRDAVREEERLEEVHARASGRQGTSEHHLARPTSRVEDLYFERHHRGARGYRAERPALRRRRPE